MLNISQDKLREACYTVRRRFPSLPVLGISWLHFVNASHPVHQKLRTRNEKWILPLMGVRIFWLFLKGFQAAFKIISVRQKHKEALHVLKERSFQIIGKTWVFGEKKETPNRDFYYGDLQKRVQDKGISMLLLCGNVRGNKWMGASAFTEASPFGSSHLPELCLITLGEVFCVLLQQIATSFQLWRAWQKEEDFLSRRVLGRASIDCLRAQTLYNCLFYWIGRRAVRIWKPKAFLTFYEGHAWEKCVWLGVKEENPVCKVVGYQHTIIMQHAYEQLKPLLDPREKSTPDIVLCSGSESFQMMKSGLAGHKTEFVLFGSFRRSADLSIENLPDPFRKTVLVIPDILSEMTVLFNFTIKLASLVSDYRFIFRCHPILPLKVIKAQLRLEQTALPDNIEISRRREINDDFDHASCVLYRGSSAVLYAILKGLKPFYLQREGEEIMVDPIFKLNTWRECVSSPESFKTRLRIFETTPLSQLQAPFQIAAKYAQGYIMPVNQESIGHFLGLLS